MTEKSCSHWAPESICIIVSEKESVTNLTGTMSFWSISRGDVGVGGEMVKMIKSYKIPFIYWSFWKIIEKPTFTWTFAALNPPTVTSLRQRTSPSQSILPSRHCEDWHVEPQLDKSGGTGQMVPSPKMELLEINNPYCFTEICRSRLTWMNGFWFFDFFLMAELSESAFRYVPEKRLYREHVGPVSCIWKLMVSVRPYIRPAGTKSCQ